jgi:hypothetical protein
VSFRPLAKTFVAAHAEDFTSSLFWLYHLRFETMEHSGEFPDTMPQAIKLIDAEGRSCIYVPITQNGKVVDSQGGSCSILEDE